MGICTHCEGKGDERGKHVFSQGWEMRACSYCLGSGTDEHELRMKEIDRQIASREAMEIKERVQSIVDQHIAEKIKNGAVMHDLGSGLGNELFNKVYIVKAVLTDEEIKLLRELELKEDAAQSYKPTLPETFTRKQLRQAYDQGVKYGRMVERVLIELSPEQIKELENIDDNER